MCGKEIINNGTMKNIGNRIANKVLPNIKTKIRIPYSMYDYSNLSIIGSKSYCFTPIELKIIFNVKTGRMESSAIVYLNNY